jgi:hypothetical protein
VSNNYVRRGGQKNDGSFGTAGNGIWFDACDGCFGDGNDSANNFEQDFLVSNCTNVSSSLP